MSSYAKVRSALARKPRFPVSGSGQTRVSCVLHIDLAFNKQKQWARKIKNNFINLNVEMYLY